MFRLSFKIIFILVSINLFAQSPHGDEFDQDCSLCHNSDSWKVDLTKVEFDHSQTKFALAGQHQIVDCKSCHTSLVFSSANTDCFSCHKDIHQGTVGFECANCHTPTSWVVKDINGIHQTSRFPLLGAHKTADCAQCHSGFAELKFEVENVDCYACHVNDYNSARSPDHVAARFSTDCQECHQVNAISWNTTNVNHSFFPLTGGHALPSCFSCHQQNTFSGLDPQCVSCHQDTYNATTNPNHSIAGLPTTCEVCHSINSWSPAQFNHDITQFPLTGAHTSVACATCHTSGYTGTPAECYACHQSDYQSTTDPNHVAENYPTDCTVCHNTTNWEDANFDHNITQFSLTGAHTSVACATCHTSGYTGTPAECYACHQTDYDNTTDPNHQAAGFPTSCIDCHTTTAWDPATFDHDNQYFPIYSGEHNGKWNSCSECHTTPNNFSVFSCIDCHEHNQPDMDNEHQGVQGYNYNSADCFACHPQGRSEGAFNHATSNFVLVGEHLNAECTQCHQNGYSGTSSLCSDCHINQYNSAINPNHQTLGLSTDCSNCHTPETDWQPATFPQHDQVFALTGAHLQIASNCATCHNGNYTSTPNECVGCHQTAFNNAVNPNHTAAGISTTCESCHNSTAWIPSTFSHTTTGFELLGAHQPLQCSSCHIGTITGLDNQCISCHLTDFNSAPNHSSQSYPTTCELCHNSVAWNQTSFNHSNTSFPLTGAHTSATCNECHSSGYTGTPTQCYACHQTDYEQSVNPSHTTLGLSTSCETCHTTNAGWVPATFSIHDNFYQLVGAHLQVNNCADCHQGNYINTPNTCIGCHTADYNGTTNPPHQTLNFSDDCLTCHTMNGWTPANFDHSFFPTGNNHNNVDCNECHSETNYQPQCLSCHMEDFLDEHDLGDRTDCWNCHGTNDWDNKLISPGLKNIKVE